MGNATSHQHGGHGGSTSSTPRSRGDSSPAHPSSSALTVPTSGNGRRSRSASLTNTLAAASIFSSSPLGRSRHHHDRSGSLGTKASAAGADREKELPDEGPPTPRELVSGGHLSPQGRYAYRASELRDYHQPIVKKLILDKKLAPFYRGLEDFEEDWDVEKIVKELRELRKVDHAERKQAQQEASSSDPSNAPGSSSTTVSASASGSGSNSPAATPIDAPMTERERKEARAYKGSTECPICFLYYPPNINTSRCCQQPICTECFVQIKRAEATVTHLESEPAACPYCMEPEFGVIYEVQNIRPELPSIPSNDSGNSDDALAVDPRPNGETIRRKSVSSKSKEVVTIDQIRPDWEDKLNAVKAAAARRASRRIIMQRVGDRLIPVGYTSSRAGASLSGDTGPITTTIDQESLAAALGDGSSRSRRSRRYGSTGGIMMTSGDSAPGPTASDIEEMMIMEAMRLSLLEHEEQQRKQEEEKRKKEQKQGDKAVSGSGSPAESSSAEHAASGSTAKPSRMLASDLPVNQNLSGSTTPLRPLPAEEQPHKLAATTMTPPSGDNSNSESVTAEPNTNEPLTSQLPSTAKGKQAEPTSSTSNGAAGDLTDL